MATLADVVLVLAGAGRVIAHAMPVVTLVESALVFDWIDDVRVVAVTEMDAPDAGLVDDFAREAPHLEDILRHRKGVGGTRGLEGLLRLVVVLNPTILLFRHL